MLVTVIILLIIVRSGWIIMIIDVNEWSKIIKKVFYVLFLILMIFITLKLAWFFIPFLIALIIANCIEPLIKLLNKKTKLLRNTCAKIALIIVFSVLIGILGVSATIIVSEAAGLLKDFGDIGSNISGTIENISNFLKLENVNISDEVRNLVINSTNELINHMLNFLNSFLTNILNLITQIPTFVIYLIITILATYFICIDRISLLDNLEQQIPKHWLRKANSHFTDITKALGKYLKAELILVFISFVIVLIGLYLFKFFGLNIKSPFLISLGIGFVDLLPILGSGTVMLPWGIISIVSGDIKLGVAVLVLLLIISLVRQFLEPRIVSGQLGIHPLYTLIAMYVGFKFSGVLGLLIGPIVLIVIQRFFKEFSVFN